MNSELALLSSYLWFFLAVAFIFLVLAPFLIWKNTANTTGLLRHLLEEQERTNDLLALLIKQRAATTPLRDEDIVTPETLDPEFILEEN